MTGQLTRAERRLEAGKLFLQGYSIREIAKQLNCSKSTIHTDINACEDEWGETWKGAYESLKIRKLAELNNLKKKFYKKAEQADNNGDELASKGWYDLILKNIDTEIKLLRLADTKFESPVIDISATPVNADGAVNLDAWLLATAKAIANQINLTIAQIQANPGDSELVIRLKNLTEIMNGFSGYKSAANLETAIQTTLAAGFEVSEPE